MFIINWQLALVSLVTLPFIGWRSIVLRLRGAPDLAAGPAEHAEMTRIAEEGLTGIRVVKAFSRERFESDEVPQVARSTQADLSYYQAKVMATPARSCRALDALQIAITVGFGAWLITQGHLTQASSSPSPSG